MEVSGIQQKNDIEKKIENEKSPNFREIYQTCLNEIDSLKNFLDRARTKTENLELLSKTTGCQKVKVAGWFLMFNRRNKNILDRIEEFLAEIEKTWEKIEKITEGGGGEATLKKILRVK